MKLPWGPPLARSDNRNKKLTDRTIFLLTALALSVIDFQLQQKTAGY